MKQIIFGTRQIGGPPSYGYCDRVRAQEILLHAFSRGIRVFDTAPIYGAGTSEKLIGETLHDTRKEIQIITKFGFRLESEKNTVFDFSPQGIQYQLEQSLERLRTNYIDVYLLHIPHEYMDIPQILRTLNDLKNSGVIKEYGICNTYLQQLHTFLSHPLSQATYVQDFYNLLERKAETLSFPFLKSIHKFLAYGPLYRGVLTQKSIQDLLKKNEDGINRLIKHPHIAQIYRKKEIYSAVAKKKNISIEQLALEFLVQNASVHGIVFGTQDIQHLDIFCDTIEHLDVSLT